MKLKKIASLALAGIMAVSMLAGCQGRPTTVTVALPAVGLLSQPLLLSLL